jgi:type IV pilus assembly protein PilF
MKNMWNLLLVSLVLAGAMACTIKEPSQDRLSQNRDPGRAIEINIELGMRYLKAGDLLSAHRVLNRAYEIDQESPAINNALALLYRAEGDQTMVEKHYQTALATDPAYSVARTNYGVFLFEQGRYAEALTHFELAAQDYQYANRFQVYENMGLCYLAQNDIASARGYFQRALQINPKLPISMLKLAEIAFLQKNTPLAEQYLQKVGEMVRSSPAQLWLGIRIYRELGDQNRVASLALALKNLYPDSPEYRAYSESVAIK